MEILKNCQLGGLTENLIDSKESLLSAMESLSEIRDTENLQLQLKDIYNTLEMMHDNRRDIESSTKLTI